MWIRIFTCCFSYHVLRGIYFSPTDIDMIQVLLYNGQVSDGIASTKLQNQLEWEIKSISIVLKSNTVLEGIPHPCSKVHDQLSSLADTQKLWYDLCRQTYEVRHLVIMHYSVLVYYLPYER